MLKLFPLHQQHRIKNTSLNWFVDAEQHKNQKENKMMPGRGRGIVGSEKGRRGRGEK